jgi:hypothetical protein
MQILEDDIQDHHFQNSNIARIYTMHLSHSQYCVHALLLKYSEGNLSA